MSAASTMMKPTVVAFLSVLFLMGVKADGMAPPYVSDEQLAGSQIIVVAKWEKSRFEPHCKTVNDPSLGTVVQESEAYTKLHILRIVKGDVVAKGDQTLMVGFGISWSDDGQYLNSGTSTELMGDVQDVTKLNLWFLSKARSWDESRTNEYLSCNNYRQIQPLELEDYFQALGSARPETEVPRLLASHNPEVALRVLRYISGDIWPWPYDPSPFLGSYDNPEKRGRVLNKEADRVWGVVAGGSGEIRPYALSVFADLQGRDSLDKIRTLLKDKDPQVRGMAIGILAGFKDEASLPEFQRAIQGVDDGRLACKLIERLQLWDDERVVPALITFLQNGQFAYQYGDDIGIPALKARQALQRITGHVFPLDVAKSEEAWIKASQMKDVTKRKAMLDELPGEEVTFLAELTGEPIYPTTFSGQGNKSPSTPAISPEDSLTNRDITIVVSVHNITQQPTLISKWPSEVSMSWPAGCASRSGFPLKQAVSNNFVTIYPWQPLDFKVNVNEDFLLAEPSNRRLTLSYRDNGNAVGVKAWMGTVEVKPGPQWKEKRLTEQVEVTWPNGNLKAKGVTVNGHRYGEWNFFNEQGDRIEAIYYASNRGSAKCNPEHPDNKGAGKRPKPELPPKAP